jgi:hypothetical protein
MLVMTLLVRDEIDIVRRNIEFHLAQGVDHIIATDNGSVDGTRDILSEFERRGVVDVLDEPGRDHSQAEWVTRMALMARDRFGARWLLNADADEFWLAPSGDLKCELLAADVDTLVCRRREMMFGYDSATVVPWPQTLVYRTVSPKRRPRLNDNLSDPLPYPYLYFALPPKLLMRAARLRKVGNGNHTAKYEGETKQSSSGVTIYHFPIRSAAQFERKVRRGGQALARNTRLSEGVGWHWRRWHRKLASEGLEATLADALPSADRLARDFADGLLMKDVTMADLLSGPEVA